MAIGLSLHIGVNTVNLDKYTEKVTPLEVCENDATAMLNIAESMGYSESRILIDSDATRHNLQKCIDDYSNRLKTGDIFLITFSGHGYYADDIDGDEKADGDESDVKDECWCFYDGKVLDDDLYEMWHQFDEGVRILVVSDSCYSGDMTAILPIEEDYEGSPRMVGVFDKEEIPVECDVFVRKPLGCTVKLLGGCSENETAKTDDEYSSFTKILLDVWNDGRFQDNYEIFHYYLKMHLSELQRPSYVTLGQNNIQFDNSQPFKI